MTLALSLGLSSHETACALTARLRPAMGTVEEFVAWFAERRGIARGRNVSVLVGELRRLGVSDEAITPVRETYRREDALLIAADKSVGGLNLAQRFKDRPARRSSTPVV